MKASTIFPLMLAGLVTAQNPMCDERHPAVHQAISAFCARAGGTNLVVPSWLAFDGQQGPDGTHVSISGDCGPNPQWVPQEFCYSQFEDMCARRETSRNYGNYGCQTWLIKYAPPPPQKIWHAPGGGGGPITVHPGKRAMPTAM